MRADEVYLLDMLNAARKIKEFTTGMAQVEFYASELHQNAIARLIQVIGEAARLVSDQTKAAHPEIPWRKITGMRNTIIHRYFSLDLQIVWDVIANDLDDLIAKLESLIPDAGGRSE